MTRLNAASAALAVGRKSGYLEIPVARGEGLERGLERGRRGAGRGLERSQRKELTDPACGGCPRQEAARRGSCLPALLGTARHAVCLWIQRAQG